MLLMSLPGENSEDWNQPNHSLREVCWFPEEARDEKGCRCCRASLTLIEGVGRLGIGFVRPPKTDRRGARTLACSVATPRDARSVCTLRASSELDAARMSACATTAYAQLFLRDAMDQRKNNFTLAN